MLKSLLGALVVLLISLLSRSRNYVVAGLLPLFPTFALIAHYIVGSERGVPALKLTLLFGMWGMVPYFIYLLSLYLLLDRLRLVYALGAATLAWVLAALVINRALGTLAWLKRHN
ncbi:GlpM family protein [Paludibacterium denitrificans]|uniref:GlpM family protein n=1 Tax=Paludibacterium denitrificans TaxID=2675226 RepID=UPI001E37BD3D|nr:GlpM family protein [Paludibacterium denitrificans]